MRRAARAPLYSFRDYALYIALFPQILAGPLVRHSEIVHQFRHDPHRAGRDERIARGLVRLVLGLVQKVFIADAIAGKINPLFAKLAAGETLTGSEAWVAILGFTFQIFFDFAGYTDMAIGLALMFGFVLPENFKRPYAAASLQDFWRRWHMTLSRFLRDYLYIPLGGSRSGLAVQLAALMATMLLGGLWHGAGWNFVIWGGLHGVGLAAGVLWRRAGLAMPQALGVVLTFLFVVLTWVFFRSSSFDQAIEPAVVAGRRRRIRPPERLGDRRDRRGRGVLRAQRPAPVGPADGARRVVGRGGGRFVPRPGKAQPARQL